jgi:hypothetical protein
MKTVLVAVALLLSACAHAGTSAKQDGSASGGSSALPSREQVLEMMRRLAPRVAPCVPDDRRYLQIRLTLGGAEGRVLAAEVLAETVRVCHGLQLPSGCSKPMQQEVRRPAPSDPAIAHCVREAVVGQEAPTFTQATFHVSYPVAKADCRTSECMQPKL